MYLEEKIELVELKTQEINKNRNLRKSQALRAYIDNQFPVAPKQSLETLNFTKTLLENHFLKNPDDEKITDALANIISKINNEDYLKPDTPDMDYYNEYTAHINAFQWPTTDEIQLQADEDLELETLINSLK